MIKLSSESNEAPNLVAFTPDELAADLPNGEPILTDEQRASVRPTVPLFELDGHEFRVPAQPSAAILLRFMRDARVNELAASANLLEELLGREGFDALANHEALTGPQLQAIIQAASALMMGRTDGGPKAGKSS